MALGTTTRQIGRFVWGSHSTSKCDFDFQPLAVPGFARSARKLGNGIGADDG